MQEDIDLFSGIKIPGADAKGPGSRKGANGLMS